LGGGATLSSADADSISPPTAATTTNEIVGKRIVVGRMDCEDLILRDWLCSRKAETRGLLTLTAGALDWGMNPGNAVARRTLESTAVGHAGAIGGYRPHQQGKCRTVGSPDPSQKKTMQRQNLGLKKAKNLDNVTKLRRSVSV